MSCKTLQFNWQWEYSRYCWGQAVVLHKKTCFSLPPLLPQMQSAAMSWLGSNIHLSQKQRTLARYACCHIYEKKNGLTRTGFKTARVRWPSSLFGTSGRCANRICWKPTHSGQTVPLTAAEAARWRMWPADRPIQESTLSPSIPLLPLSLSLPQTWKTHTHRRANKPHKGSSAV